MPPQCSRADALTSARIRQPTCLSSSQPVDVSLLTPFPGRFPDRSPPSDAPTLGSSFQAQPPVRSFLHVEWSAGVGRDLIRCDGRRRSRRIGIAALDSPPARRERTAETGRWSRAHLRSLYLCAAPIRGSSGTRAHLCLERKFSLSRLVRGDQREIQGDHRAPFRSSRITSLSS